MQVDVACPELAAAYRHRQVDCSAFVTTCNPYSRRLSDKANATRHAAQVNNDAWDIAFSAFGFQDAGIFINESSSSSMGQNLPQTELYYAETDNFNATIDVEAIKNNRYLNTEESWNYGAFNEIRDTMNPYDFGWGEYLPSQFKVVGDKVYVIGSETVNTER